MDTRFEESHPRSPFGLNVVTIIVYAIAAIVVFCWFLVFVDDGRPISPLAPRTEISAASRGAVVRPTPVAVRDGAPEERMPSQVRPAAQVQ